MAPIRQSAWYYVIAGLLVFIFCSTQASAESFSNRVLLSPQLASFKAAPSVSWRAIRYQCIVAQKLDYSCGSAALATLLSAYWRDNRFSKEDSMVTRIKKHLSDAELNDAIKNGFSFLHLQRVCAALGYLAEAYVDVPPDSFAKIDLPVIVRIKRGKDWHFVVVNGLPDGRMLILDPALGNIVMSLSKFTSMWDGRILEVQHSTKPQPAYNSLTKLTGGIIAAPLNYSSQQIRSSKVPNILKR